jgi:hypothetical protein
MTSTARKASRWKWIHHEGEQFDDVGVNEDGTLHNPNNYPAETVRAAITAAEERWHQRRSKAAKKAAETRRRRQERRVYEVAKSINAGTRYGPGNACVICKRGLGDPESIQRGIGSECWQDVLDKIQELIGRASRPDLETV